MQFNVESEHMSDGTRRVHYYYKCPMCNYRMSDATLTIRRDGPGVVIRVVTVRHAARARTR